MKHYLFIKDNGTEIVSVIKDSMRRKRHYLFIKDNETVITVEGAEINILAKYVDDTTSQKTAVKLDSDVYKWNIKNMDDFANVLWAILQPLAPVLKLFLTGDNLEIYGEITIRGFDGYEGVLLPIIEALGVPALKKLDGTTNYLENLYTTQEEYETAVAADGSILIKSILDAVMALVN